MKVEIKKVVYSIIIMCIVIFVGMVPKAQATGLVIAFSQSTANIGDEIIVTITGTELSGTVNLDVSGNATLSQKSVALHNDSANVIARITGEGPIRITATATEDMKDSITGEAYTGSTGGTITVENAASKTSSTEEKSSNANLSNLGIKPNDFSGFMPNTTTYNVTVPENVESVDVYAIAQDSKSTISGTGSKTLAYGENALNVVVTAEDGTTKKTYTINVTREAKEQTTEETEIVNGLSNIIIGNLELSPSFKKDIYEYTVTYIGEDTSLDIQTVATDPSYRVDILGNEELKEGENIITILVSDSQGNNVATYQLTVNKSLVDKEALSREEAERKKQEEQKRILMIAGGMISLIIIIVIIIVLKRRRTRAYEEEFSGVPFAGMNDEDEYYDDYYNYDNEHQIDNYHNETVNEQSDNLQENYDNEVLLEETSRKLEFDDSEEKREKEKAKREFLKEYNSNYTSDYEEDKPRRGRRKGKRFK